MITLLFLIASAMLINIVYSDEINNFILTSPIIIRDDNVIQNTDFNDIAHSNMKCNNQKGGIPRLFYFFKSYRLFSNRMIEMRRYERLV